MSPRAPRSYCRSPVTAREPLVVGEFEAGLGLAVGAEEADEVAGDPAGGIGADRVLLGGDAEDVKGLDLPPGLRGQALGHRVPPLVADEFGVEQARVGVERSGERLGGPHAPSALPSRLYWATFFWSTTS